MEQQVSDIEYVELPPTAEADSSAPVFVEQDLKSDTFGAVAWFVSHFGVMSPRVWWGYKTAYYLTAFPLFFCITLAIDLAKICFRFVVCIAERILELFFASMQPALKIVAISFVLFVIVMFVSTSGCDGMKETFANLCQYVKNF